MHKGYYICDSFEKGGLLQLFYGQCILQRLSLRLEYMIIRSQLFTGWHQGWIINKRNSYLASNTLEEASLFVSLPKLGPKTDGAMTPVPTKLVRLEEYESWSLFQSWALPIQRYQLAKMMRLSCQPQTSKIFDVFVKPWTMEWNSEQDCSLDLCGHIRFP